MTRVDFYLLAEPDFRQSLILACKITEKAYRQGHRIFIKTNTDETSRLLDNLLWTFRQGSFIPHELYMEAIEHEAPVLIGHIDPQQDVSAVLVNLSGQIPVKHERYARIAEIIENNEASREQGRIRFRTYRHSGHELETHEIRGNDLE